MNIASKNQTCERIWANQFIYQMRSILQLYGFANSQTSYSVFKETVESTQEKQAGNGPSRLNKTRKPLFLQLETTKALKKTNN